MSFQTAALTLSWIVIVVLALGLAGTLQALRRLQGEVTELAAVVDADHPGGGRRRNAAGRFAPERHAFAFVMTSSAGCPACADLMPRFAQFAREHADVVEFHVLTADAALSSDGPVPVTVDPVAFAALSPGYTPAMVVVDRGGAVVDVGPAGDLRTLEQWIDKQKLVPVPEEAS